MGMESGQRCEALSSWIAELPRHTSSVHQCKQVVSTLSVEVTSCNRSPIDFWLIRISRTVSRLHKFNVAFYNFFVWLLPSRGISLLLENTMETALLQAKGRRRTHADNLAGI